MILDEKEMKETKKDERDKRGKERNEKDKKVIKFQRMHIGFTVFFLLLYHA